MSKLDMFNEDINIIANAKNISWNKLENKSVLITGGTGLIGSIIVKALVKRNEMFNSNIKIVLIIRNIDKAKKIFEDFSLEDIEFVITDNDFNFIYDNKIDYIIHGAAPTTSKYFTESPIETINSIVSGTNKLVTLAKEKEVDSCVLLSSMEAFGKNEPGEVDENTLGSISLQSVRSSYPEAKRISELLAYSYFKEYNVPVKIARLAQTFGAGVLPTDNRVFRQFADSVIKDENIIIKSTGNTIINFCYTTDAVVAIFLMLTEGTNGETYNVSSDDKGHKLKEIAEWIASEYSNISEVILEKSNNGVYPPDNEFVILNDKLKQLGWEPSYSLRESYDRFHNFVKSKYYE